MCKILATTILFSLFISSSVFKKQEAKDYVFKRKSERKEYINSYNKSLLLWNVPYHEEDIRTSLGNSHVIISGPKEGKPVVLLHGMDASSTMWYPNIKALSKNNRVYAIDFIMEVGKSRANQKSLSKEELVTWYNEIFNHYKLKNITIIGASKGGWLATLLATQKGNTIKKLALLSPAQTFQYVDDIGKASSAVFLKLFPNKEKLENTLDVFSFYPNKINSVYKNQFYLGYKYAKSNSSFLQMQPFSDEDLKNITIPVLVIIGDHDIINTEKSLLQAKKLLPNCKTETLKNAGHFLSIDHSQITNKLLLDFLK